MALKLYVVHGSHPCAAVEKALQLKGLPYTVWEWPPPMHTAMQRLLFGARTVPALRNGAEKLAGSRAIVRRLDEMVPSPALLPADPALRERVLEAERWGDEEFQQDARDILWATMVHRPAALVSYASGSKIPLPAFAVRGSAPLIAVTARAVNHTGDTKARMRLAELPGKFDRIDAWLADGTLTGGAASPNAADLQILSTVRLMSTMADIRPLLDGRPCLSAAQDVFPEWSGDLPAGALA